MSELKEIEDSNLSALEWKTFEFYLGNKPFRPVILELGKDKKVSIQDIDSSCNSVLIKLDVSLCSSLKWEAEILLMQEAKALGKKIFLDINFGLGEKFPSLSDMTPFLSLGLGIDALKEKVIEPLGDSLIGAFLLKDQTDFSSLLPWDAQLVEEFLEFEKEEGKISLESSFVDFTGIRNEPLSNERRFLLELFSKDLIVNYLNLLLTQLPESLAAFIHFQPKNLLSIDPKKAPMRTAYLLERRSLGHIHLAWEDKGAEHYCFNSTESSAQTHVPTVGILLPELNEGILHEKAYNEAIVKLRKLGLSFRFVGSEAFHEEWHLLDFALGAKKALSREALRQVMGFNASGGIFIFLDEAIEAIDIDSQVSIKAFISEQVKPLIAKATSLKDLDRQTS